METFPRDCPQCGTTTQHTTKRERTIADRLGRLCLRCACRQSAANPRPKKFFRHCPACLERLGYSTKAEMRKAERRHILCRSCKHKEVMQRPESIIRTAAFAGHNKTRMTGPNNPFFGHTHSKATIRKIRQGTLRWLETMDRKEHGRRSRRCGRDNGMFGKSLFDVWAGKYGVEVARKKSRCQSRKLRRRFSGSGNPMYGRPSPKTSGTGWGGWYKGWYFRSLRELSYVVLVLEQQDVRWEPAEQSRLTIHYVLNGVQRTYHADFLVEGKMLVEIKPKRLMGSYVNMAKAEAARSFCKSRGMKYIMADARIMTPLELQPLIEAGLLRFNDKWIGCVEKLICAAKAKSRCQSESSSI